MPPAPRSRGTAPKKKGDRTSLPNVKRLISLMDLPPPFMVWVRVHAGPRTMNLIIVNPAQPQISHIRAMGARVILSTTRGGQRNVVDAASKTLTSSTDRLDFLGRASWCIWRWFCMHPSKHHIQKHL